MPGTTWLIVPHTQAKHIILQRYLEAWFPIMATQSGRLVYIDGFAGPGRYAGGEDGSPIIALRTAMGQPRLRGTEVVFLFIELDAQRKANLEQEVGRLAPPTNFSVTVHQGRFDETLAALLDRIDGQGARLAPTFAFLDPFGWSQTPMALIARLLRNRSEVLITFIYEEINRFLGHPDQTDNRDRLFGSADWRPIAAIGDPSQRRRLLHDLYDQQLSRHARFVRSFEMRNIRNATDYFLFFATNHVRGLEKMKEAMWKADPLGGARFSDATDPQQLVLFGPEPEFATLRRQIAARYAGQTPDVDEIERFVIEETAFLSTHYKRILRAMERERPPSIRAARGPGGRRGTFPGGTAVTFLS